MESLAGLRERRDAECRLTADRALQSLLAPEPEIRRWFSWPWYWTGTLIDDLVRAGRLCRLDGQVAAT